jgi:hypothetical protein
MHKCLSISEVVSKVCLQLVCDVPYASNGQYPGTLAAFAATCRAISEPALDTLWHTQSTIAPLLRCMPSDLWEGAEVEEAGSPLVFHLHKLDCAQPPLIFFFEHSTSVDQLSPQTGADFRFMRLVSRSLPQIPAIRCGRTLTLKF